MTSIIYIGMDVHTTDFTFCCYTANSDRGFAIVQTQNLEMFLFSC